MRKYTPQMLLYRHSLTAVSVQGGLGGGKGFPGGSDGKESACSAGYLGSIPELGRSPRRGHGNPLQYSFLENLHGQRNLAGYGPRGCKESDTTE